MTSQIEHFEPTEPTEQTGMSVMRSAAQRSARAFPAEAQAGLQAGLQHERFHSLRIGVHVEQATVVWMLIEAAVALGAGIVAGSALLTAFGIDSVIEIVSGGVLLWRLVTELRLASLERVERAERRAAWVTGVALVLLCIYVAASAGYELFTHARPDASPVGIGLALAALVVMPVLARSKRTIARQIGSAALRGDAACSITCAYMAATLLAGLLLTAAFGWWWADGAATLVLLYWLVPEAREALQGARAGRAACGCGDDDCGDDDCERER